MPKMTAEQREALIADLATNCECWKGEEDVLNQLSDDKLQQIQKRELAVQVANAAVEGFEHNGAKYRLNPETGDWETAPTGNAPVPPMPPKRMPMSQMAGPPANEPEPDPEDQAEGAEPGEQEMPQPPVRRSMAPARNRAASAAEWLREAPSEVQQLVENAQQIEAEKKDSLIRQILANVAIDSWQGHYERLMNRSVAELQNDLALIPKLPVEEPNTRNARTQRIPYSEPDDGDVLALPTSNWSAVGSGGGNDPDADTGQRPIVLGNSGSGLSEDEWLAAAPPHMRSRVMNAFKLESSTKRKLIDSIVANANITDEQAERRLINRLETKSMEELQDIALLNRKEERKPSNFFGAAAPLGNQRQPMINNNDQDDLLIPPSTRSA